MLDLCTLALTLAAFHTCTNQRRLLHFVLDTKQKFFQAGPCNFLPSVALRQFNIHACRWCPDAPANRSTWLYKLAALPASHAELLAQAERRQLKSTSQQATPQQEVEWKQRK